jgi:hypothetical protein
VVLQRASVFAAPFTAEAATTVTGFAPLAPAEVAPALAGLADHSLLVMVPGPNGTRYRMLETIRQHGAERLVELEEADRLGGHHLRWCLDTAARLETAGDDGAGFDAVVDDLRAALGWAAGQPSRRAEAHGLAEALARLTFARGLPSEAQRRYEEAAALAADLNEAARDLHHAATVAWGRLAGNESLRLFRQAATAARRGGDRRTAAVELASAAELIDRCPGTMSELPPPGECLALLDEARSLAGGDAHVEAAVLTVIGRREELDPASLAIVERAVELARRVGDARLESAALDQLTSVQLAIGDRTAAQASIRRRLELLTGRGLDVEMAWEYSDTVHMAPMVFLASGDLAAARRYSQLRAAVPLFQEAAHLAVPWTLTTAALAGDFDEAVAAAERFRRGWVEAGRPTIGGLSFAPSAAAMVHGIRGDEDGRQEWLAIMIEMRRVVAAMAGYRTGYLQLFDAVAALHRGDDGAALAGLSDPPEHLRHWYDGVWRQWYAAVWAEAAVLGDLPDRRPRLDRARYITAGNPVATALVDRAAALATGDTAGLLDAAAALEAAGCPYQRARTLVLAGGAARAEGEAVLAAIGAAPMAL